MERALVRSLEEICSPARIGRYRFSATDDLDTVTLYLWNIQLAESLLPSVALLEISLRNAVHRILSQSVGTQYWFTEVIHPRALMKFRQNENEISRRSGTNISIDKLVSELSFGFWTSLFTKHYHPLWWQSGLNPLLAQLLPHHPGVARDTRKMLGERLDYFLRLRNRMMHQESIFEGISPPNKPLRSLGQIHAEIYETLKWINPEASAFASIIDRFPHVFSAQWKLQLRSEIEFRFQIV